MTALDTGFSNPTGLGFRAWDHRSGREQLRGLGGFRVLKAEGSQAQIVNKPSVA